MKLLLKNLIEVDGKEETVLEEFEGTLLVRGSKSYLEYFDQRKIKTILSYDDKSLKRIVYTDPRTIMHFSMETITESFYDSLGWLKIETLDFSQASDRLALTYRIIKDDQVIGNYRLEIFMAV